MDIIAPLDHADEAGPLLDAGADELFCGVVDENWRKRYGRYLSPNRRETGRVNLESFDDLATVVCRTHERGKKVQFCLNASFFSPDLAEQIDGALDAGVDRVIVASLPVLNLALKRGCKGKICLSSGAVVLNSEAVRFYREMGVTMIILPRDLSLAEIRAIASANTDMRFEVFILNEGCANITGFCSFAHRFSSVPAEVFYGSLVAMKRGLRWLALDRFIPERVRRGVAAACFRRLSRKIIIGCSLPYSVEVIASRGASQDKKEKAFRRMYTSLDSFQNACGACAMAEIQGTEAKALKIAGRGRPTEQKIRDVRFIKAVRDGVSAAGVSDAERHSRIHEYYEEFFGRPCSGACYYQKNTAGRGNS